MTVQPTVLDVARGIARLDEHADTPAEGSKQIDGQQWTRFELQNSVAKSIAFQLHRHVYGGAIRSRTDVTKRDVAMILGANGATAFTIEQHARAIAALIRVTDGR